MCWYVSGFIAQLGLWFLVFVKDLRPKSQNQSSKTAVKHSTTGFHLMIEPCFRHAPITFHLIDRQPHHLSRLFNRQAAKESELDYATLLRCNLGQLSQSFIE